MVNGQEITGPLADRIAEYEKTLALCVNREKLLEDIEKLDIAKHWKLLFQWIVEKQPAGNDKEPEPRQRIPWEAD
jgi:hypothetical protein